MAVGSGEMGNYWLDLENIKSEEKVSTWDFETALGETIREKYESLYVRVVEVSNIIHRKTVRNKREN